MKSILVVSTAFAPENAIGAVRVSKLVKHLVRLGHPVTVISPELPPDVPRDDSLECPELQQARRHTVAQGRLFDRFVAGRRREALKGGSGVDLVMPGRQESASARARAALFRHVRFAYSLLRNLDWQREVVRYVRARPELGTFDVVLSSYPSLGGMWAAAALRKAGVATRWIADFRDPVNYRTGAGALVHALNTRIQRRLLARADAVVAVSRGVGAKLEAGGASRGVTVVYNGFDPEDAAAIPQGSRSDRAGTLDLCYTGSLYGGTRDISVVFRALRELVDAGAMPVEAIRFAYAGADFSALQRQAAASGMSGVLVDHGRVPRERALQLLAAADLAVVATWNTPEEQGIMTGKLFECFMVRTPVLGVVTGSLPGSEFKAVVDAVGGGFVYEEAAPDAGAQRAALGRFLEELYAGGGSRAGAYRDSVLDFSYPRLAARISSLA